jgi:hypothetical protein
LIAIRTMSNAICLHDAGAPRPPTLGRPLLDNHPPVPTQDRIGRHDRRHLRQHPPSEPLALRREAPTPWFAEVYVAPGDAVGPRDLLILLS